MERSDDRGVCPRRARARRRARPPATYLDAATRAATFIRNTLWVGRRGCCAAIATATPRSTAYAEDYAYLIWGLLELFQAGGDPAVARVGAARSRRSRTRSSGTTTDGGWFSTTGEDPTVLLRLKEDYDGAEPAASSIAALNALTIAHLTGDERVRSRAERTLARYGPRIGAAGRAIPMMLCALSAWHAGMSQVVIVGARRRVRRPLLEEARAPLCALRDRDSGRARERARTASAHCCRSPRR